MEEPTSPRKRRRTRSSAVADIEDDGGDFPSKRPDLKASPEYSAAIAVAASMQVEENEQMAQQQQQQEQEREQEQRQQEEQPQQHQIPDQLELPPPEEAATVMPDDPPPPTEAPSSMPEPHTQPPPEALEVDVIPEEDVNDVAQDSQAKLADALAMATSAALSGRPVAQPNDAPLDYGYVLEHMNIPDPNFQLRIQSLPILENLVRVSRSDS